MKSLLYVIGLLCGVCLISCEKGAGEGGQATISGKVIAIQYNKKMNRIIDTFEYAEADVYIIYSNDEEAFYGDRTKTGHNGNFEFNYLREGEYTVYTNANEKDTVDYEESYSTVPVIRKVFITSEKQVVFLDSIMVDLKE